MLFQPGIQLLTKINKFHQAPVIKKKEQKNTHKKTPTPQKPHSIHICFEGKKLTIPS